MKQNTDKLATKQDLKELEKELKNEIKKSAKSSDQNLTKRLLASQNAFRLELNHQFQIFDERWERRFSAFTDRLLTLIEPLLKEIETRQQDREIASNQMMGVTDRLDNHEKRLAKLEQS